METPKLELYVKRLPSGFQAGCSMRSGRSKLVVASAARSITLMTPESS